MAVWLQQYGFGYKSLMIKLRTNARFGHFRNLTPIMLQEISIIWLVMLEKNMAALAETTRKMTDVLSLRLICFLFFRRRRRQVWRSERASVCVLIIYISS